MQKCISLYLKETALTKSCVSKSKSLYPSRLKANTALGQARRYRPYEEWNGIQETGTVGLAPQHTNKSP